MPPTNNSPQTPPLSNKNHLSLSLNLKFLVVLLLVVIAGMLFMWKPWQANIKASDRTVTVTGDATLSSAPDEYVFSPSYNYRGPDKETALGDLTTQNTEILKKLKSLDVKDSAIKSNASDYTSGIYPLVKDGSDINYMLDLTITIDDKALAQKVQDYLLTTSPSGSVSPLVDFSDSKRKTLESQARDQATKDARAKADQSAKNLGFKVAAVKSVTDGSGFNAPISYLQASDSSSAKGETAPSLAVQPGENKLQYSVTVVYYIK